MSQDELHAISELGKEHGLLDDREFRSLKSFLKFGDISVDLIMTPKSVVCCLPSHMTTAEAAKLEGLKFSRIPVYGESEDDLVGFVLRTSILESAFRTDGSETLDHIKRPLVVVPKNTKVKNLFYRFLDDHEHIAAVVDEYGTLLGLVTLEDVVETVLGEEIKDETDEVVDTQEQARRLWQQRARRMGLSPVENEPSSDS